MRSVTGWRSGASTPPWSDSVAAGDQIDVGFHPLKDGSNGGQLLEITKSDGTYLCQGGACRDRLREAAAALLPCPWTYHELGSRLTLPDHPVLNQWVEAYSSGLLERSTTAWRALVDRFGADGGPALRDSMRRAFLTSSRYEYMFWTMAYKMESWPV